MRKQICFAKKLFGAVITWLPLFVLGLFLTVYSGSSYGDDRADPFELKELIKRKLPDKPVHTIVEEGATQDAIIVKFIEGTDVRLRNGKLISLRGHDLATLRATLAQHRVLELNRLFDSNEQELTGNKYRGQQMSGQELADLNLYYRLSVDMELRC